jgi:segregation and condensation protein B
MRLTQIIEALLFASDAPLSAADLSRVDERLDEDTVEAVIHELRAEYELSERSFQIYEVAGGYQLLTRPEFVTVLERYDSVPQPSRLSAPGLEVLAIIAYRQPLGRAEVEEIRGVGSSGVLRTLQERNLIEPVARGEGLGRPLLYGTTKKFLEHFGFRSLEDLPRPDELPIILRDRPTPQPAGASEAVAGDADATVPAQPPAGDAEAPPAHTEPATEAEVGPGASQPDRAESEPVVPVEHAASAPGPELLESEPAATVGDAVASTPREAAAQKGHALDPDELLVDDVAGERERSGGESSAAGMSESYSADIDEFSSRS